MTVQTVHWSSNSSMPQNSVPSGWKVQCHRSVGSGALSPSSLLCTLKCTMHRHACSSPVTECIKPAQQQKRGVQKTLNAFGSCCGRLPCSGRPRPQPATSSSMHTYYARRAEWLECCTKSEYSQLLLILTYPPRHKERRHEQELERYLVCWYVVMKPPLWRAGDVAGECHLCTASLPAYRIRTRVGYACVR